MRKVAILLLVFSLFLFGGCEKAQEVNKRPVVGNSTCAKFEYVGEENAGYKVITSEIQTLSLFFDSIILEEVNKEISGDWIYRITFNWNQINANGQEIVVLIGEDFISYDGTNYFVSAEADFSDILSVVQSKYEYFDYEIFY